MPEDFFESEVAVAVAATAAAMFSPRVRGVLRQGLVYGVAGVTVAASAVSGAAQTVGRTVAGAVPIGIGRSNNARASSASRSRPAAGRRTAKPRPPCPAHGLPVAPLQLAQRRLLGLPRGTPPLRRPRTPDGDG